MGWMALFSRAFYAFLNTRTPIYVSAFTLCVNVACNFALWKTPLRHGGLALGSSIAYCCNAAILFFLLNRKLNTFQESIRMKELTDIIWKALIPALAVGLCVYFFWPLILNWGFGASLMHQIYRMTLMISLASVTFVITAWLCGMEEIRKVTNKLLG
jgi:putative peptidoglycan lipid II flippase